MTGEWLARLDGTGRPPLFLRLNPARLTGWEWTADRATATRFPTAATAREAMRDSGVRKAWGTTRSVERLD